jgi:uncharacterized protein YrrD
MKFRRGADVVTPDGDKVGDIDRVVIDPKTQEVTHLVVAKGFLLTTDKVLPLNLVGNATEDQVMLREDVGDLEELPDYKETHFVEVEEIEESEQLAPDDEDVQADTVGSMYWVPPAGRSWWGAPGYLGYPGTFGYPAPPFVRETERNIPEGTVALNQGAPVFSGEGEHVGDVEEVFTDPQGGRVTHILVSQGLLFEERKRVPTTWIKAFEDNEVYLAVGEEVLDRLPDYDEEAE